MDLQDPTSKMSKTGSSPKGLIDLMRGPGQDRQEHPVGGHRHRRARSATTPTPSPGVSNLLVIHSRALRDAGGGPRRHFAGRGYGDLKKEVAEVVVDGLEPFQKRMAELLDDPAELDRILADGADRAREVAWATMARVRAPWVC